MPGKDEVPSTVKRSDDKAMRTWVATYDSAMESYDGDGERAHRMAFAALKHTHEKVGDHWEPKEQNGPSDEQAAQPGLSADGKTAGGVAANASKQHLYDVAKKLDISGRSSMSKDELVEAIQKANTRETAKARKK
ncbi:ChaB family protein [Pseudonocardia nigra]|uniref:ChaB family protein n=1 Tax=Pseudonocardia nigra TaxID=1921578 RepID=UPI001C5E2C83|nr:ChaB family protein [Pseudonocardia nigra]